MAQTTYTSTTVVTLATRAEAYNRAARLLLHLDALNLNLVSIIVNADHTVSFTLNNPISAEQLDHLVGF